MTKLAHMANTQQGKNRFSKVTSQLELIGLTTDEKKLRELYRLLQFFPTPPWATRALIELLIDGGFFNDREFWELSALEPAAGQGHIVKVLREYGFGVTAYDIHDYGFGFEQEDFLTADYAKNQFTFVIMNPPFGSDDDAMGEPTIADKFIEKALELAPDVFVFARHGFITPGVRYDLMNDHLFWQYVFVERVPIALGRISKKSGATDYAWYHFKRDLPYRGHAHLSLIAPGTRDRLTRHGDA